MSSSPLLLPTPRQLTLQDGSFVLADGKLIVLDAIDNQSMQFTAQRLQTAVSQHANVNWSIVAGTAVPHHQIGIQISIVPTSTQHSEGYNLTITSEAIHVVSSSAAGAFYAVGTLIQLLNQYGATLPALRIVDWPDFPNRGVMFDISRNRVPTMETLYNLVDTFASWKFNQLQLYMEHTFAYQNHPVVWEDASPMTGEEILALDAYCRERFIELIPNQNTFGHMRPWLTHEEYRDLAECPHGCDTEWGHFDEPFSLNPGDPRSLELVRSMIDELLPHFSSTQFNVGLDETVDLGNGRSKEIVAEKGSGRVYLDFLLKIYDEVKARGRTMQFWGDIIVKYPDLVAELPRDLIALEWGYEANHPFDKHGAIFAESGIPFYVCPGTATWNTLVGRTDNCVNNLLNAAKNGLKNGAVGLLMTDWGDRGHWQPLPVSYLGFGFGAAVSWAYEANKDLDIPAAISRYAFDDPSGEMGKLVYDLGNNYLEVGMTLHNSNPLFHYLQVAPEKLDDLVKSRLSGEFDLDKIGETAVYIDKIMAALPAITMNRPDADLIKQEITWAADMLKHGSQRAAWLMADADQKAAMSPDLLKEAERLIETYYTIWHTRCRPGGYADSVARMETMKRGYL